MNYETPFHSQVAKRNSHNRALSFHKSLLAMMLVAGSAADGSQRIPILSSVGRQESVTLDQDSDAVVA